MDDQSISDVPAALAAIITGVIVANGLPIACSYVAPVLYMLVAQTAPPPDFIIDFGLAQTGLWASGIQALSTPYDDGAGLAGVPLYAKGPRAGLIRLAPLAPPPRPPE